MLYELSVPYYPGMPRYDDTIPDVMYVPRTRTPADVNNTTMVHLFTHSGSHVDAPFHFDGKGSTIDQIPIDRFLFTKALTLRIPCEKGGRVSARDLAGLPGIFECDMLMIYTGYSAYIADEHVYADNFPALDITAARFLRRDCPNLRGVAIDTMSIEGSDGCDSGFEVHHELLDEQGRGERSLLVFENLDLTSVVDARSFYRVYAFPLRFVGLDASPVNVIAEVEI